MLVFTMIFDVMCVDDQAGTGFYKFAAGSDSSRIFIKMNENVA